jgi:hypothetical protein
MTSPRRKNHPIECRCGTLKGYVTPGMASRGVCYCKDCQAFAHFLASPAGAVLNELGGTEVVATLPGQVHFTQGMEALVCMSLSDRGLLRWYTSCCNTPIGNTPRDFRTSYVGLVHSCLSKQAPSLQDSFGPMRMVLQTKSARGPVKSTPLRNLVTLLKIMQSVVAARVGGGYRGNPFFDDSGKPVKQPRVLTKAERLRATSGG